MQTTPSLWHVIVTFSLSQELLDYLIKCYPVDKYNFDLSLSILVYIPPVIFHVKFCEQLEAHVFNFCRSYNKYYKVESYSQASIAQLVSAITQKTNEGLPCEFASSQNIFCQKYFFFKIFIDNSWNYLLCNMVIFSIKMTAIKFPTWPLTQGHQIQ